MARGTSQIAGQDYMNSYSRILDALKMGQGGAAAASAGTQQMSQNIGQSGANQANITLDQGQSDANLWRGLGQLPGQAVAAYQNAQAPLSQPAYTPSIAQPSARVVSEGWGAYI
jgi:hypothetical protein